MEQQQKNYFAVIPASVRYDKRLKPLARLLYGEITALSNDKGYCWASNSYFAELYETTNETISRYISQLKKHGYIKVNYDKTEQNVDKRKIYIIQNSIDKTVNGVLPKQSKGSCQDNQNGIDRTVKDNNTESITNNNTEKEDSSLSFDLFVKELCIVFEHFTAKTANSLSELYGFKTKQKQAEIRKAFDNRHYDWAECVKCAKKSVELKNKQNLTTRWLDFLSYLIIFLKNGDEINNSIKRYYTIEELEKIEKQRQHKELEEKLKKSEEERIQLETDKQEAQKMGMTLEEYYQYCEEEAEKFFSDLKKSLRGA